jgi:hypothetical protein
MAVAVEIFRIHALSVLLVLGIDESGALLEVKRLEPCSRIEKYGKRQTPRTPFDISNKRVFAMVHITISEVQECHRRSSRRRVIYSSDKRGISSLCARFEETTACTLDGYKIRLWKSPSESCRSAMDIALDRAYVYRHLQKQSKGATLTLFLRVSPCFETLHEPECARAVSASEHQGVLRSDAQRSQTVPLVTRSKSSRSGDDIARTAVAALHNRVRIWDESGGRRHKSREKTL